MPIEPETPLKVNERPVAIKLVFLETHVEAQIDDFDEDGNRVSVDAYGRNAPQAIENICSIAARHGLEGRRWESIANQRGTIHG